MQTIRWDFNRAPEIQRAIIVVKRTLLDSVIPELKQLQLAMTVGGCRYLRDAIEQTALALRSAEELCARAERLAGSLETADGLMWQTEEHIVRLWEHIGFETLIGGSSLSSVFGFSGSDSMPSFAAAGGLPRISDMIVLGWLDNLASQSAT